MKNILLSLLLVSTLTSAAKERERAIDNKAVTASVAVGTPHYRKEWSPYATYGPFSATIDCQLSKRFSAGLQYVYLYSTASRSLQMPVHVNTGGNNISYTGAYRTLQLEHKGSYHAFTLSGEYCYINRGRVWVACGIGFGLEVPRANMQALDSNNIDYSYQLWFIKDTRITARVRLADAKVRITRSLGVCAGIGLGLDGIFTGGIIYKFKGRD